MSKKTIIESGIKFHRLTSIKEVERIHKRYRRFLWKCDCGKEIEIDLIAVTRGNTLSCGCYLREVVTRQPKRENSKSWKGGKHINDDGYVMLYNREHPNSKSNGYIYEHRLVMEKKLGRYLIKGENVHHINGDKQDNRVQNLELWNTSQPCGQRVEDKLKWAKEIIELYG